MKSNHFNIFKCHANIIFKNYLTILIFGMYCKIRTLTPTILTEKMMRYLIYAMMVELDKNKPFHDTFQNDSILFL